MSRRSAPRTGAMRPATRIALKLLIVLSMISIALTPPALYLRSVSSQMAVSDAIDLVTLTINDVIHRKMSEGTIDYNYFVNLEKDAQGNITAITSNMSRINTLSAEILQEVVNASGNGELDLNVPLGNLLGTNLLHGRGPDVPVRIIMLTSSFADFRNELSSAGINQTKHQIILEIMVDIDVLIPWETLSTRVVSEVLVAETVIVGQVPDTYLRMDGIN